MKKIQRLATKIIAATDVTIVDTIMHRGHYQFTLIMPSGAQRLLTVSGSPRNLDHTLNCVCKDVERLIKDDRISYPLCA
jgi:hypothetical protein